LQIPKSELDFAMETGPGRRVSISEKNSRRTVWSSIVVRMTYTLGVCSDVLREHLIFNVTKTIIAAMFAL
jgi:hypothetical protein